MSELANHDQEDDEGRDPGPELIRMHDFVAEERDEEGAYGDDDDACVARDIIVDRVDELSANNDVDRRPADAGE